MKQESTSICDLKYKIVFLGEINVGKTSIIERFVKDEFDANNNPTVGIDFLSRNFTVRGKTYRLQLWDTAGQQKYKSLVPAYIRDASCAVFVFDLTRKESFENLRGWLQLYHDNHAPDSLSVIVGNKYDLLEDGQQRCTAFQAEIQKFCENQNLNYIEVSAKSGKNVTSLFTMIVMKLNKLQIPSQLQEVLEKEQIEADNVVLKLESITQQKSKQSCCYI